MDTISWRDFEQVDLRAGTIIQVDDFPKARKPRFPGCASIWALKSVLKQALAQITARYTRGAAPRQTGPLRRQLSSETDCRFPVRSPYHRPRSARRRSDP